MQKQRAIVVIEIKIRFIKAAICASSQNHTRLTVKKAE